MIRPLLGDRLLFIGDSITECGRERVEPPLGGGFVQFAHCFLAARHPDLEVEFVNRGVNGETIVDLERRWERDVVDERPDHLFVMIGANDLMCRLGDPERAVSDELYEATYRRLMERTRAALDCRITLMDPAPLEGLPTAESHAHVERLCAIVERVAADFDAARIPTFERFRSTVERAPEREWMIDVPHPNLAGHAVIALAVLEHLGWTA